MIHYRVNPMVVYIMIYILYIPYIYIMVYTVLYIYGMWYLYLFKI